MLINWIRIKGFRNFDDETIHFSKKTLIIGANDIGKSNLLYALRILFDKSLNDRDLELSASDYNAYSKASEIEITVEITNIREDCLRSVFREAIKDDKLYIQYKISKGEQPKFYVGYAEDLLEEKCSRFYIRNLNMEYVDTNRDLFQFIKKEKNKLMDVARDQLDEAKSEQDSAKIAIIQKQLTSINDRINSLNYIKRSLCEVNKSLALLSVHNEDQEVRFLAGHSDVQKALDNLSLSYSAHDNPLSVGGDGRNNQIYLATWVAKQKINNAPDHVTFFAIEEPEAHLHPHQQRKLSQYLFDNFDEQIFITTHSTHISYSFSPKNIVRLYSTEKISYAAQGGCSHDIEIAFDDFGYRLNAISAETFFADGVFFVEGVSEVLFYKALASALKIDLDHYNISIVSVEGIGFKPYIKLCRSLEIPFVLRTDNDIFVKIKRKKKYNYLAGITRAVGIYNECIDSNVENSVNKLYAQKSSQLEWIFDQPMHEDTAALMEEMRVMLEKYGIFLSDVDLETDLAKGPLSSILMSHYKLSDEKELIEKMQERKAENMLEFVAKKMKELRVLHDDKIINPIKKLVELVERGVHPHVE